MESDLLASGNPTNASRTIIGSRRDIAPDGHIIYAYRSLNPEKHVANTLDALRNWTTQQKH